MIGLHDIGERAVGAPLDRGVRHERHAVLRVDVQARVHELVGKERPVLVREKGLELHRAGRRIDLVVDGEERPRGEPVLEAAVVRVDDEGLAGIQPRVHGGKVVFGDGEHDRDRLQLGDHHDPGGVGGVDDVPRVDETETEASGDRGGDAAVVDVGGGGIDLALIELDRALVLTYERRLLVERLLRDRIFAPESFVARQVDPRFGQQRLVAGELPLGLQQLGLEWARVDLGEQVAFTNELALAVWNVHQLAVHAGVNGDGVDRRDRTEAREVDADVSLGRSCRLDRDGRGRACGGARGVPVCPRSDAAEREHHDRGDDDDPASPNPRYMHAAFNGWLRHRASRRQRRSAATRSADHAG